VLRVKTLKHFTYISIIGILFSLSTLVSAENNTNSPSGSDKPSYYTDEYIVTASRLPMLASSLSRTVRVITRLEIDHAPVSNVADLLAYSLGIDLQTRGPNGVQSDLSLRGSSSEETLVLLDGVRLSDPQTGHHTLNLPISLGDVERVEILYGHGSHLYGPSAMGGVVNIITRNRTGRSLGVKIEAGDYGLLNGTASVSAIGMNVQQSLSFQRGVTGNYIPSSESDLRGFSYHASRVIGQHKTDLSAGWQDKRFGAATYYSTAFPQQYETTDVRFLALKHEWNPGSWLIRPELSWRGHKDDYLLNRTNPAFYHNHHETDVIDGALTVARQHPGGVTTARIESSTESIESSSLGAHRRERLGLSVEQRITRWNPLIDATISLAGYDYSNWGFRAYPGVDLGYQLSPGLRVFATAGGAFRAPTYTDLYYISPANKGNPDLKPEKAITWEGGGVWTKASHRVTASYFHRSVEDVIDWARALPTDPWQVLNVESLKMDGAEVSWQTRPVEWLSLSHIENLQLAFSYITSAQDFKGLTSKYVLAYPRKQTTLQFEHRLPMGVEAFWFVRHKQRVGQKAFVVTDLRLNRKFANLEGYISATNLFSQSYQEVSGVPMPKRWFKAGVNWELP